MCYEDVGSADLRQLGCNGVYSMKGTSGYAPEESDCLDPLVAVCYQNVWGLVGVHSFVFCGGGEMEVGNYVLGT